MDSYRFRIGRIECRVIADKIDPLTEDDVRGIFPNDSERMVAAFHESSTPPSMSINVLFLDAAGKRILVDSGIGHQDPDSVSLLLDTLRAEGIAPESINTVILTHFHLDHLGGLTDSDGKRTFPNARLVAAQREYDHWMNEAFLATMDAQRAATLRQTFAAYPNYELIAGEAEVEAGVRLVHTPGHTPGHVGVMVQSEGECLLHIVDTAHFPFQLNNTDAVPRFDNQPEVAIATRRAAFARAANENLRLMIYHFPFPGVGHVQRAGNGLSWIPDAG